MRRMQRQRVGDVSAVHFQMVAGPMVHSSGTAMEPKTGQVENVVPAEEVDLVVEDVADERRVRDVEPSGGSSEESLKLRNSSFLALDRMDNLLKAHT
jgi:hypothetical protein